VQVHPIPGCGLWPFTLRGTGDLFPCSQSRCWWQISRTTRLAVFPSQGGGDSGSGRYRCREKWTYHRQPL